MATLSWVIGTLVGHNQDDALQPVLEKLSGALTPDEWLVVANALADGGYLALNLPAGSAPAEKRGCGSIHIWQ